MLLFFCKIEIDKISNQFIMHDIEIYYGFRIENDGQIARVNA